MSKDFFFFVWKESTITTFRTIDFLEEKNKINQSNAIQTFLGISWTGHHLRQRDRLKQSGTRRQLNCQESGHLLLLKLCLDNDWLIPHVWTG